MGDRLAAWANTVATGLFGPVFALEATRIGRRNSTFLVRWLYLLALTGVLGLFYLNWWSDHSPSRGVMPPSVLASFAGEFFWVYAVTQFLVVTALTPAFTAAAITEEKERKSLDDLLTTDLTGREIVFGKLAVRVGVLMSFVLAGVPILALLEFFGGIEPLHLLVAVGMTLVTVLSLSAVGAAASVQMLRTRESVVLAYALPVAYLILSTWWLAAASRSGVGGAFSVAGVPITQTLLAETFAAANPFEAVAHLDRPGRPARGTETLGVAAWYGGFHLAVAALGFAFAARRVRSCARTPGWVGGQPKSPLKVVYYWLIDRRTVARKHPLLGRDPVWWKEVWVEPGSSGGLFRRLLTLSIIVSVILPLLMICSVYLHDIVFGVLFWSGTFEFKQFQGNIRTWAGMVTGGVGMLMLLRAAIQGATAVAGERDRDTWISLLATPLTRSEIFHGKWAGCVWGQRRGLYLLSGVAGVGVLTGSVNPVAMGVTAVLLLIYLRTFAWIGLWCSLAARSSRTAIARAASLALLMGGGFWLPLGCCLFGCATGGAGGRGLGYLLLFLAGWTPLVNLGAIPLLRFADFEKGNEELTTGFFGLVLGTVAWWFLGNVFYHLTSDRLKQDTNRE